jgi:thioesterase domain-containing protein/acyl carrier protein
MSAAIDEGAVRAAVASAWREELPHLPFDETLTWRDAGVDSLKSLQILLRLERALDRAISFDLFTLDSRAGEVIQGLVGRRPTATVDADDRKLVFLLPGIVGDDRNLAGLRRHLAGEIRFETLAYPELDAPAAVHSSLDTQIGLILEAIGRLQPVGSVCLAGYSFGGFMAFETARRLMASGREVGLLVLLDSFPGDADPLAQTHPQERPTGRPTVKRYSLRTRFARRPGEGLRLYIERLAFKAMVKFRRLETARRLACWAAGHTPIVEHEIRRREVLWRLRGSALERWRPQPCPAPTLLITSDEYYERSGREIWPALCSNLTVRHVGGSHMEVFRPEALAVIGPALVEPLSRLDQRSVAPTAESAFPAATPISSRSTPEPRLADAF